MSLRHLFSRSSFCRQFKISFIQPRLQPTFLVASSLLSRSYGVSTRTLPRDEAIKPLGREIEFIDASGLFQGLKPLDYILANFDREKYHLVCLNPHVTPEPVRCRLFSKEQLEEDEKAAYWAKKEKKQGNKDPTKVVKKVEISWATAPGDLEHKLKRINEFLQRGNRVEVILGVKKGMAKQPLGRMVDLVERVRTEAEKSGKEWKEAEGVIGVQYLVYLEGKRLKKTAEETKPIERVTREERRAMKELAATMALEEPVVPMEGREI